MDKTKEEIRQIAFAITQHEDDLQLYANGLAEDAIGEFDKTVDAIMELIYKLYEKYEKSGIPMSYQAQKYIKNLLAKIEEIRNNIIEEEIEELVQTEMQEVAKIENDFLFMLFGALGASNVSALNREWLNKISQYGIYNGRTISEIFKQLSHSDSTRIHRVMIDAIKSGKNMAEARQLVIEEMENTRRFIRSEINTIVNGVVNDTAMAFATVNKSKMIYSSVLDDRRCEDCGDFHGHIYNYNSPDMPSLPQHINCRCYYIPIMDNDPKNKFLAMPFPEYFDLLDEDEQRKRLGEKKYAAYKDGSYKIQKYERPLLGQRLELAEIAERDKIAQIATDLKFNPHHFMEIDKPITGNSLKALRLYTDGKDFYRELNAYMRNGESGNANFDWHIKQINRAIQNSRLKKGITVYRGVCDADMCEQIIQGKKGYELSQFYSTSVDRKVAEGFAKNTKGQSILFEINIPQGTVCLDVSRISTAPKKEEEILFGNSGNFVYNDVYYDNKSNRLIVRGEYVPDRRTN